MTVPVHIISGFLGVGKTTAIIRAFEHRPAIERWAVLVNEFGEVGIDGAALESSGGYIVKEIAGGCICCTASPLLKLSLVRLLREEKPDRVWIEPTGLAHPATIIDMLRSPGLREAVEQRALIGLVNPTHFSIDRYRQHETYQDQLQMADILIGNHWDSASDDDKANFLSEANAWYPPKLAVHTTSMGALKWEWLEVRPVVRETQNTQPTLQLDDMTFKILGPVPHQPQKMSSQGWVFPTHYVFDRIELLELLQTLVRPNQWLEKGALRLKGVFRTRRTWLYINGTPDTLNVEAINYRRDSRMECIVEGTAPNWEAIEDALKETRCAGS